MSDLDAMVGEPRTIILFGAKRSGSTAVFRMFQRHPDVGVCHVDQTIHNFEPNFWNFAAEAVDGEPARFTRHVLPALPFLDGRIPRTRVDAFAMWDQVLAELGPAVFDKSPRYLSHPRGLDLLLEYASTHDVRFIAIVRDPRDVIASQYELWGLTRDHDTPAWREDIWVEMYERLIELQHRIDAPVFRYEDLAANPAAVGPQFFAKAGLSCPESCLSHLRPINVGRHRNSENAEIQAWRPGERMLGLMARYGYAEG